MEIKKEKSEYIMWSLVPVEGGKHKLVGIKEGNGYTVFDHIGTIDEMAPVVRELNERDNPPAKPTVKPFTVYYRHQNGFGFERKFECYAENEMKATSQFRRKYGYNEIRIMRIQEGK